MLDGKTLKDIYCEAYANIVEYLVAGKPDSGRSAKADTLDPQEYEDELGKHLMPILKEIDNRLESKYKDKHVRLKKAIIQCNSLNPQVNARLRIPWELTPEELLLSRDGDAGVLCLYPDRPTHILTEILLRLRPEPVKKSDNHDSAEGWGNKDWVGILRQNGEYTESLLKEAERENYLCCGVTWDEAWSVDLKETLGLKAFSNQIRIKLEEWRGENNGRALVALNEQYPSEEGFYCVTERVFDWFKGHEDTRNAFYLADLVDSEQLAGIAIELEIGDETHISDIHWFLKDYQWMMNRYVFSLLMEAEKTYSGEGPSYPDAYFARNKAGRYEFLEELIKLFAQYDDDKGEGNEFNLRYKGSQFNSSKVVKDMFRKIRVHFEITKGEMGKYAIGYKKHAYEVACVVGGIMDVLFFDKSPTSIEFIVRSCSPGLEGLDIRLEDDGVPFLFRQLFKGLSKEDQLFLIPQYREHFIHSFYVFAFGVALMSYAPDHVIPEGIKLKAKNNEQEVKDLLRKWFMVSMWHDIAYMIEKGNLILEQHVLSLMRKGRREKNLLPWLPSLGNLLQVDMLLDEIRQLSEGSISICSVLTNSIDDTDVVRRLAGDVVIAAAFDRRDHGVWSAMMFNHAWDANMTELYCRGSSQSPDDVRKEVAKAILPHNLADWNVRDMLADYDTIKTLPKTCTSKETMFKAAKACMQKGQDRPSIKCANNHTCWGKPVVSVPHNGNEMGYLLGICDMVSQAGRENAELPNSTSSNLGIKYRDLRVEDNGTLSLCLRYTEKEVDRDLFCERYVQPALFLGLTVCCNDIPGLKAINIEATSGFVRQEAAYFYHESIREEAK